MEAIFILIGLFFLASPIIAIVALVKASNAQNKIAQQEKRISILSRKLEMLTPDEAQPAPQPKPAAVKKPSVQPPQSAEQPKPAEQPTPTPKPAATPKPVAPPKTVAPPKPKPRKNLEEALGGKAAGIIGVLILVAGIAFLVGSPGIAWPTPIFKILMGLFFGGCLLAAGYFANRTAGGKFVLLSRILTGGGGGLFYFCIFAAYRLYGICNPLVTALGLTVCAGLLLFLSLIYNSQMVATLGILGAFITPLLTGGDVDQGTFPLAYIALINLPVMFLGVKKNWQVLYNSSTIFTWLYFFFWMVRFNSGGWLVPLSALSVYTAEFMTLSVLILRKPDGTEHPGVNIARITASTIFLFLNLYLIFSISNIEAWLPLPFAICTALFVLLARLAGNQLKSLTNETLCFILCGSAAGALFLFEAAPAGLWGLFWCIQATGLAWFFRKQKSAKLMLPSILLTVIGSIALVIRAMDNPGLSPDWFNAETLVLLGGAFFTGTSAWILRLHSPSAAVRWGGHALQFGSFAAIAAAAGIDIFMLNSTDTVPWISAIVLFAAATLTCRRQQPAFVKQILHFTLAALLCLTISLHMLLDGLWISLAWGLLGPTVSLFAIRIQSKEIQNGALLIGFAALLHATLQPINPEAGWLLANPHTLCGLFTALSIGAQAKLYERLPQSGKPENRIRILWLICIGAVLFISIRNLFTVLDADRPLPWLLSSVTILFVGNIVSWMLGHDRILRKTGRLLVAAVPAKILLLDVLPLWVKDMSPNLLSLTLWGQITMLAEILWFGGRTKPEPKALRIWFSLAPLIAGIAIISLAIGACATSWSWAIVSLWWGVVAMALTLFGFIRKSKLHRHFALILFAATVGKVLLIDCSIFEAGPRVMICIGVGLLLLILSFVYQKVSSRILQDSE